MSYYREVVEQELVKWLVENLDADTPEELAKRLIERFDVLTTSNSPKYNG